MANTDVLSAKIAVARMKRYLADPAQRISLQDLVISETEKAYAQLNGPRFPVTPTSLSSADISPRLKAYEATVETVLRLMICGAHWGEQQHEGPLLRCFKRIADQRPFQASNVVLERLARYPALLLLYGAGIAAITRQNYSLLKGLFGLKVKYDGYKPEKIVAAAISDQVVLDRDIQKQALGSRYSPLSDRVFEVLRDPLREYLPSDGEYDRTFDWFEYLLCLSHCDASVSRSDLEQLRAENPNFTLFASVGRFGWKGGYDGEPSIQAETELIAKQAYPEKVAAVLKAGFFESGGQLNDDKYREVKAAFDRHVKNVRMQWT